MNDKANSVSSPDSKFGTVGKLDDGRSFVLFERRLSHSIERVWAAITEPTQLANWAPGFRIELKQGGQFDIWFGDECEGPAHVTGTVTEYDPPRILQFGSMRFELEADGSGCLLKFSDILHFDGSRTETQFTNDVLGGWHRFLDDLEVALNGNAVDRTAPEFDYSTIDVPGRE